VKYFIGNRIEKMVAVGDLVYGRFVKPLHDHDGAIRNIGRPVSKMVKDEGKDFLCFQNLFPVGEGMPEKLHQPVSATQGPGKIYLVKNGGIGLIAKDGKILVTGFVNFHTCFFPLLPGDCLVRAL
jgi:hypothetical protein